MRLGASGPLTFSDHPLLILQLQPGSTSPHPPTTSSLDGPACICHGRIQTISTILAVSVVALGSRGKSRQSTACETEASTLRCVPVATESTVRPCSLDLKRTPLSDASGDSKRPVLTHIITQRSGGTLCTGHSSSPDSRSVSAASGRSSSSRAGARGTSSIPSGCP